MKSVTIRSKATGKTNTAQYAPNSAGNMRYNVDGKFLTDKQFGKQYEIITNEALPPSVSNIVNTLKGKKVLFLENGIGLEDCSQCFQDVLSNNDIENKVLEDIDELPFDQVLKAIAEADAIVFETQWVYDISKKLSEYMFKSQDKKIVIECYIMEPTYSTLPKAVHDVYIFTCDMVAVEMKEYNPYRFYRLSKKPYWKYKNKFDK